MWLFNLFKKDEKTVLRKKFRKGFDDAVADTIKKSTSNDNLLLGLLVQSAIANFYSYLRERHDIALFCEMKEIPIIKF